MPLVEENEFEGDQHLLLYGTLKPGEPRWPSIESHVEIVSEEQLVGSLRNYKNLFPVFTFDNDDMIQMVLVRVDTPNVKAFFKMVDDIEGHPHFFRRSKIELFVEENEDGEEVFLWPWLYEGRHPDLVAAPLHDADFWESPV